MPKGKLPLTVITTFVLLWMENALYGFTRTSAWKPLQSLGSHQISYQMISQKSCFPPKLLRSFFVFHRTNTHLQLWSKLTKWDLHTSSRTNTDLQNAAKPNRGTLFSLYNKLLQSIGVRATFAPAFCSSWLYRDKYSLVGSSICWPTRNGNIGERKP